MSCKSIFAAENASHTHFLQFWRQLTTLKEALEQIKDNTEILGWTFFNVTRDSNNVLSISEANSFTSCTLDSLQWEWTILQCATLHNSPFGYWTSPLFCPRPCGGGHFFALEDMRLPLLDRMTSLAERCSIRTVVIIFAHKQYTRVAPT